MFFSFVINPSCFGSGELGSKPHCQRAREPPGQRQHEVRGRYWGYSGLMQGRQHLIPWMTPGYCSQNEDGSPSEEQSQDSLLELVRQRRTVDWIRQADCYLQLKKKFSLQKDLFCFVMTMGKRKQILILRSDAQTLSYWDRIPTLFQKQISKTFPRLGLIFPGLQISPYTLSFPRFKNRFSLQSTNISYNANSENFISWVKQISRTFQGL